MGVFKPAGIPGRFLEEVVLGLDGLEALRLAGLEGLYHEAAAARMGVSRATFGRIVEDARRRVAEALVEGKLLRIEGGPVATAVTDAAADAALMPVRSRGAACSGRGPGARRAPASGAAPRGKGDDR